MRVLLMVICLSFLFVSCEKGKDLICKAVVPSYEKVVDSLSSRWDCDYALIKVYFMKPVNDKFCSSSERKGLIVPMICQFVVSKILSVSADKSAEKYKCSKDLVLKDIGNVDKLCSLLKLN